MGKTGWITSVAGAFLAVGAIAAAPSAQAGQAVVVVQGPQRVVVQPPVYRAAPAQRVWVPGHWVQRGHHRTWVQGHWVVQHPQHVRAARRDLDRDGVPNRYDRDRDGDGVANRYDRAPDNVRRH